MKLQRTHIIALVNHKGGCGKTTSAVNIASACAIEGYKTAVVDIDEQCNLTDGLGVNRDALTKDRKHTVLDAYLFKRPASHIAIQVTDDEGRGRMEGNLFIVPGHRGLSQVTPKLDAELHSALADDDTSELDADDIKFEHRHRLKRSLDSLRDDFDFVFIDTPPDLGFQTTTALIASDWIIVPVFPSGYDMTGLEKLISTASKVRKRYNSRLTLLGVLLGNKDARAKLDADIYAMLNDSFQGYVFESTISSSVKQREATVYGRSILEHSPAHKSAEEFLTLGRELIKRLQDADRRELADEAEDANQELLAVNR